MVGVYASWAAAAGQQQRGRRAGSLYKDIPLVTNLERGPPCGFTQQRD